jgi:hypothetical protein
VDVSLLFHTFVYTASKQDLVALYGAVVEKEKDITDLNESPVIAHAFSRLFFSTSGVFPRFLRQLGRRENRLEAIDFVFEGASADSAFKNAVFRGEGPDEVAQSRARLADALCSGRHLARRDLMPVLHSSRAFFFDAKMFHHLLARNEPYQHIFHSACSSVYFNFLPTGVEADTVLTERLLAGETIVMNDRDPLLAAAGGAFTGRLLRLVPGGEGQVALFTNDRVANMETYRKERAVSEQRLQDDEEKLRVAKEDWTAARRGVGRAVPEVGSL